MKLSGRACVLLACLVFFMPLPSLAGETSDGFQLQHFRPATNGTGGLGVEGPALLEPMTPFVSLVFDFASAPLMKQYVDAETSELVREPVVDYQFITHVSAGLGILPWFDFGLTLPLAALQQGEWPGDTEGIPSEALGDVVLVPRVRLLDGMVRNRPFSVTLTVPVSLPTGNGQAYMGEQGVTLTPQLVAGRRYVKAAWNAAVGYRYRKAGQFVYPGFKPLELGSELVVGAAFRYQAFDDLEAVAEVEGSTAFVVGAGYDDVLEARVGIGTHVVEGLSATVGLGFGVTGGYGTPLWRGLADLSYTFGALKFGPKDSDGDGIADDADDCIDKPEDMDGYQDADGCPDPDNDGDGVVDAQDKCPDDAEDADGFDDADGCPDPDNDQDGVLDTEDQCPNEPEDQDQFEDEDGCPDLDHDHDGILDSNDACPEQPETRNGYKDDDGCPEPDQDGDTIPDEIDKCPKLKEVKNGFRDDDGCPERDRDKDGIPDAIDKCPRLKETVNGYQDTDGCPERDRDRDGIIDALDKCPKLKEPRNGIMDDDGCPDADRDGDGIPDVLDRCRKKPETVNGYKDDDGCPDTPPH